ncbi:hypothetical protein PNF30_10555 [Bacillus safensis]|uniref:hypothetical protein n=1 Tax=Bacillus safensis TaxID=561879 RepID=UPI002342EF75|nr:hypothetical protein [Bacillus safensis]WCL55966.1 hypothetical protein PNF30_10555 [Bacillus safensis]
MKLTLLDNGIDSVKAAYNALTDIEFNIDEMEHRVKDAVIFLNHANEILFKLLIKQSSSEALNFVNINSYMEAKEKMVKQEKNTVFEIDENLKTIGFFEAIRRLELICDIEVCSYLKRSLRYLNKKRNEIMHYEIHLTESEFKDIVLKLKRCQHYTVNFFSMHIEDFNELLQGARFEFPGNDPDVEAMHEEAYLEYLEEQNQKDFD